MHEQGRPWCALLYGSPQIFGALKKYPSPRVGSNHQRYNHVCDVRVKAKAPAWSWDDALASRKGRIGNCFERLSGIAAEVDGSLQGPGSL